MIGLAASTSRCEASVESMADFLVDADVVVRELAHISGINTEDLRLLCGTERESRNDVHNPEDYSLSGYISVD